MKEGQTTIVKLDRWQMDIRQSGCGFLNVIWIEKCENSVTRIEESTTDVDVAFDYIQLLEYLEGRVHP